MIHITDTDSRVLDLVFVADVDDTARYYITIFFY